MSEQSEVTAALVMARDLIATIVQTSGNVWYVDADDPETAVCDTLATIEAAIGGMQSERAAVDQGCATPPVGWWCSRSPGHEGPCAARRDGEI